MKKNKEGIIKLPNSDAVAEKIRKNREEAREKFLSVMREKIYIAWLKEKKDEGKNKE